MIYRYFSLKKIILFLFSLNSIALFSQSLDLPINVQSPNSSQIGKFGDVPVSYFTGTPNISIPLYDIDIKGIKLPISLAYDASGIRVNEHPGWVGQNWSLLAGGVITRTIRGQFDEFSLQGTGVPNPLGDELNLGFLYQCINLNTTNVDSRNELTTLAVKAGRSYDYEPDIFTFNFMGKSGKFFMSNDGTWKVLSDDNLLVIFDITNDLITPPADTNGHIPGTNYNYPKVIGGFKVIDGYGTTYIFGHNRDAIEFSIDFFNQAANPSCWNSNAWYLSKVIDKYGNEVFNFLYERGDYIAQFYRSIGSTTRKFTGNPTIINCVAFCYYSGQIDKDAVDGQLISPVYLKSISSQYNNLSITFNREACWQSYQDPGCIRYKTAQMLRSLCPNGDCGNGSPFYYLGAPSTYIINNFDDAAGYLLNKLKWYQLTSISGFNKHISLTLDGARIYLRQVDISGINASNTTEFKKQTYKFDYNNEGLIPSDYLSSKVDHWGYYNGTQYLDYVSPVYFPSFFSKREPDETLLPYGLLKRITYPTGGYTQFEFEPNRYDKIVNGSRTGFISESGIAGGVRIKTITDNDGSKSQIRTFKYVSNYETNKNSTTSSGILSYKPCYFWPQWKIRTDAGDGTLSLDIFSVNSIIPLSNTFGSHIGYSEVEEIRSDSSYTDYKYSNFGTNSYWDEQPISSLNWDASPYDKLSDLSSFRGKLLDVSIYDNKNKLLQKRIFTYRTNLSNLLINTSVYVLGSNARYQNVCAGGANSVYTGGAYKTFYFDYDVIQEETRDYRNGSYISNVINYDKLDISLLPNNINIRLTQEVSKAVSDGDVVRTNFSYPTGPDMSELRNAFRINEVISKVTSKNGKYIGAIKITYKQENGLYVPAASLSSTTDLTSLLPEITCDRYDIYGNLLQLTEKNGITKSFVWNNTISSPLAIINNVIYKPEAITRENEIIFHPEENGSYVKKSKSGKLKVEFCSGIATLNLSNIKPGDYKLSYWQSADGINWQFIDQNINVNTTTTSCTYGGSGLYIDELRLCPIHAEIITYKYDDYGILKAQTNTNYITTHYEYDRLGRLKLVKDNDFNIVKTYDYHYQGQ